MYLLALGSLVVVILLAVLLMNGGKKKKGDEEAQTTSSQHFYQSMMLPAAVDLDEAHAKLLKNGKLKITLPRKTSRK